MKVKDYWRLAKISIKARKKATRSTVRGVSLSMIIIVPLLFAMLGLNQNIVKKLNENPEQLYGVFYSSEGDTNGIVETNDRGERWQYNVHYDEYENGAFSDHSKFWNRSNVETLKYSIHKKTQVTNSSTDSLGYHAMYEKLFVNDDEYILKTKESECKTTLAVTKEDNIDKVNDYIKKYFVVGCDIGFTGNGAKQIVLHESYLNYAGLTPADVYGKKVSVYFRDGDNHHDNYKVFVQNEGEEYPSENKNAISHYLYRDFEVVGVLKNTGFSKNDIRNCSMVVTGASYYNSKGNAVLGAKYSNKISYKDSEGTKESNGFCIGDIDKNNEQAYNYVFPGIHYYFDTAIASKYNDKNSTISKDDVKNVSINVYLYLAKDFKSLDNLIKLAYKDYENRYYDETDFMGSVSSGAFCMSQMMNKILSIASLIGGLFGGVILFAALVNLFNSIKHSVDSRRNYLGVMRAIGARDNTIPKLYFFEVMRILLRSFVTITIVGTLMCFGIMVGMYYLSKSMPISFMISWVNIPIILGGIAVLLLIIGLVYSFGCSYSLSKRPITELLED